MTAPPEHKSLIVVYHGNCLDGAASAWVVARACGVEQGSTDSTSVTYVPYDHYDHAKAKKAIRRALTQESTLYFVDCAPEKSFLDELMTPAKSDNGKVKSIHVLDHHKTAYTTLQGYLAPASSTVQLTIDIDPKRLSAAKMIWEKLLPQEISPAILDLIDMMDGAAEGLKTPESFAAAALVDAQDISSIKRAFASLQGLAKLAFNEIVLRGKYIAADQDTRISELLESTMVATVKVLPNTDPIEVPIVNGAVQYFGRQVSFRLIELAKEHGAGVAFAWYMQKTGAVTMGIRTNGNPDASVIAAHLCKTMGVTGGGHPTAAAVHFPSLLKFSQHIVLKDKSAEPHRKPIDKTRDLGPS